MTRELKIVNNSSKCIFQMRQNSLFALAHYSNNIEAAFCIGIFRMVVKPGLGRLSYVHLFGWGDRIKRMHKTGRMPGPHFAKYEGSAMLQTDDVYFSVSAMKVAFQNLMAMLFQILGGCLLADSAIVLTISH